MLKFATKPFIFQLIVVHSVFEQSSVKTMMKKAKRLVKFFNQSPLACRALHKCQRDLVGHQ